MENRSIPGPDGDVPVRIYTPDGSVPLPILVWYHGGGWVIGDLESADPTARHLCKGAGCVVVSVDYRLSPETKFPWSRPRTVTPPPSGQQRTQPAWARTPHAWPWAATARAATWLPASR